MNKTNTVQNKSTYNLLAKRASCYINKFFKITATFEKRPNIPKKMRPAQKTKKVTKNLSNLVLNVMILLILAQISLQVPNRCGTYRSPSRRQYNGDMADPNGFSFSPNCPIGHTNYRFTAFVKLTNIRSKYNANEYILAIGTKFRV